jgi:hypothetical protein
MSYTLAELEQKKNNLENIMSDAAKHEPQSGIPFLSQFLNQNPLQKELNEINAQIAEIQKKNPRGGSKRKTSKRKTSKRKTSKRKRYVKRNSYKK